MAAEISAAISVDEKGLDIFLANFNCLVCGFFF